MYCGRQLKSFNFSPPETEKQAWNSPTANSRTSVAWHSCTQGTFKFSVNVNNVLIHKKNLVKNGVFQNVILL